MPTSQEILVFLHVLATFAANYLFYARKAIVFMQSSKNTLEKQKKT